MTPGPPRWRRRARREVASRLHGMTLARVRAIVAALEEAHVPVWVAGGWGVDVLVGRRTRHHEDLDLVVGGVADQTRGEEVLLRLGYQAMSRDEVPTGLLRSRVLLRDGDGHEVEIHPVEIDDPGTQVTVGRVGGTALPCLSVRLQLEAHEGYALSRRERRDVARLRGLARPPESALIVPVPGAEAAVARWRARYDPSASRGVPAHVTVLYPFLAPERLGEDVERRLAEIARGVAPFAVRFAEVGRFPTVVYLAPDPAGPFVALTEAVEGSWPECPPYGGKFAEVVPHLTVADGRLPRRLGVALARRLPVTAEARDLVLMVQNGSGWWVERHRFRLGG